MKEFYFIRHGQTDWNVEKRLQGRTDIPLNTTGIAQAEQAHLLIKNLNIKSIVSSPLQRAHKTASIIAEPLKLSVIADERLQEIAFGAHEGRLREEILAEYNLPINDNTYIPIAEDSEQPEEAASRIMACVTQLTVQLESPILFVSHGAVFRRLQATWYG